MKKSVKKLTAAMLTLVMLFSVFAIAPFTASAAGNSFAAATTLKPNDNVWGKISGSNTSDFYAVTLPTSGKLEITLNAFMERSDYVLYDSNFAQLWFSNYNNWDATTKVAVKNWSWDLVSGTYYFVAKQCWKNSGDYQLKTKFTSAGESFKESVDVQYNSYPTARPISFGKKYTGQIAENDKADYFAFTVPASGRISLSMTANISISDYEIYDSNFNSVWNAYNNYWNESTELMVRNWDIDLIAGSYYLIAKSYHSGKFYFTMKHQSAGESIKESIDGKNNNTIDAAFPVKCSNRYKGQLANNDLSDFYKFTLSKNVTVTVNVVANMANSLYYIYDSTYNEVWNKTYNYWNEQSKEMSFNENVELKKGTYYFKVSSYSDHGPYNFKITDPTIPSKVTLSKSKITLGVKQAYKLTGKVSSSKAPQTLTWSTSNKKVATVDKKGKVTAKAAGTAKITAKTANGKYAVCTVTVKKAPSKVALSKKSLKLKKGKSYTLKASITKGTATAYTWKTSNKKIVTVNSKGKIVAKKKGKATITVVTHNGKKATCKVTVK